MTLIGMTNETVNTVNLLIVPFCRTVPAKVGNFCSMLKTFRVKNNTLFILNWSLLGS